MQQKAGFSPRFSPRGHGRRCERGFALQLYLGGIFVVQGPCVYGNNQYGKGRFRPADMSDDAGSVSPCGSFSGNCRGSELEFCSFPIGI